MSWARIEIKQDEAGEVSVSLEYDKPESENEPVSTAIYMSCALAAALNNESLMEQILQNFQSATQEVTA